MDTLYLTPVWDAEAPDTLIRVTEKYKVSGQTLTANGYDVPDPISDYWFMRCWDTQRETWFVPYPVGEVIEPVIDLSRSVHHGLGFVPLVWIRNLPGPSASGDPNDGACTFRAAIETQIEIDYQLSQAGRGLKYSSDPTLLIKEPVSNDSEIVKGAGNALVVSEKGDAKLLEIGGTASAAVIDYVRVLREMALESVHGNRASADRLTAAQSGRALELLNQGLIWLADNLRISYGEGALVQLAGMILRATQLYSLNVMGTHISGLDPTARLSLKWPRWYAPTADDRQKDAQTLSTLTAAGLISHESAVKSIADTYDIEDITHAELDRISKRCRIRRRQLMSNETPASELMDDPLEELRARAEALERQLMEAQQRTEARLIRAELRTEAIRAGMIDLDGLKLIDPSQVKLGVDDQVEGASALMAHFKRAKPWLFGGVSLSSTAMPPPTQAPRQKMATEMTDSEYRTAREAILKGRT